MPTKLLVGTCAALVTAAVGCDRNRASNAQTTPPAPAQEPAIVTKGPPVPEPSLPRPSTVDEAIDNEDATNADIDRGTDTLGGRR